MSDGWTRQKMIELGHRHARLESERCLEELMETLVPEPTYEFPTLGLQLRGGERIRRYYIQFFEDYMSRITGGRHLGQWADERAFVLETDIDVSAEKGPEVQRVISVLYAEGDRLGGERIYASERVIRMMAGKMFEEFEPLP